MKFQLSRMLLRTPLVSIALVSTTLMLATPNVFAVVEEGRSAQENGLAVAQEVDARDVGFQDFRANLTMTLKNRHGEESVREIRSRNYEMTEDGDKSLVIFDSPRDVKGTAFLTFSHKDGDDDQWLYLPALKRVKRIASSNKSGPFMGSEFAYEDISSQEVEEYTYKFLRTEEMDGLECHVIERYPQDKKSGYTRQVVWYDTQHYRPMKTEFYDRKEALLKTLLFEGYQQYAGKYWRADVMAMENHQTGKSTRLEWRDYEFQVGLEEDDFSKNSLARAR